MAEKANPINSEVVMPPSYIMSAPSDSQKPKRSYKSTGLIGYSITISVVLLLVVILGSVYYFRTLDYITGTVKKYEQEDSYDGKKTKEDIEINEEKLTVVFRLNGDGITPGTFAVLDYSKSMTGLYDPDSRQCYLIGGIQRDIVDPKTLSDNLEKNNTKQDVLTTINYKMADDYPITDKSVLPTPLAAACKHLPTYWMEADQQDGQRAKRAACYEKCWRVWRKKVCVKVCVGFGK